MATRTFTPVFGKRIRATSLTPGGQIAPGPEGQNLTTDGFISVNLTSNVEDGVEIIQRNASGALCVNERRNPSFKNFNGEIVFCGVNPSLLSLVSNAVPYEDGEGDVIGFTVPEGELTKEFALELWTGLSGATVAEGEDEASGYLLLPRIGAGTLGDITIDGENAVTFSVTGIQTKGGNGWGAGVNNVVYDPAGEPALLPTPVDPLDHLLMIDTGLTPPAHADDPVPNSTVPGI